MVVRGYVSFGVVGCCWLMSANVRCRMVLLFVCFVFRVVCGLEWCYVMLLDVV